MISVHNVPYALKCIINIFEQQIRRSFCFSQSGNFKKESASGVREAKSESCH